MNFAVLWLFMKVFSVKFEGMAFFGAAKASNPQRFSLQKSYFSPICESVLPRKFLAIWYWIVGTVLTQSYAPPFCWLGLATSMGGGLIIE